MPSLLLTVRNSAIMRIENCTVDRHTSSVPETAISSALSAFRGAGRTQSRARSSGCRAWLEEIW